MNASGTIINARSDKKASWLASEGKQADKQEGASEIGQAKEGTNMMETEMRACALHREMGSSVQGTWKACVAENEQGLRGERMSESERGQTLEVGVRREAWTSEAEI
jgi:hypothetical protein